jgi:sulfate transport system ATP-binding protein
VLVCVAVGEPGKEDVAFSGRLARHLRAEATIITVIPEAERPHAESGAVPRAERFLEGNRRAMARLGVTATTRIRYGDVREQILAQIAEGRHDLLVLGVPLPRRGAITLGGFVGRLLPDLKELPVLIIRSPQVVGGYELP